MLWRMIGALIVVALIGAAQASLGVPEKPEPKRLLQVSVFAFGESTGSVVVDLPQKRITAWGLGVEVGEKQLPSGKVGFLQATLDDADAARIAKLADLPSLRELKPQDKWFHRPRLRQDTYLPIVALKWEDKEVAYYVVPSYLFSTTPASARIAYKNLYTIAEDLGHTLSMYATKTTVKKSYVSEEDAALRQYQEAD